MADTLNYMILGYAVIALLLGGYVFYLGSLRRSISRQRKKLQKRD